MKRHRAPRRGWSQPTTPLESHSTSSTNPPQPTADEDGGSFFHRSRNVKSEQKARQLCRQVYRTLSLSLGNCGSSSLQDLFVVSVDPAPDASHLLVTVSIGSHANPIETLAELSRATGRLRAEVARDIVRKRAPEFSFRLLPREEVTP